MKKTLTILSFVCLFLFFQFESQGQTILTLENAEKAMP